MMIVSGIVILLLISIVITITLPYLLVFYLRATFNTVQMKLYNPFSLRGILINGPIASWGLSHFTVFISAIELGWSPNSFKLRLKFSNLQVYLSRRMASLCSVNLIKGNQQANILYNFSNLLFQDIISPSEDSYRKANKQLSRSRVLNKTAFIYFLQGIFHLLMIFIMKTFQIVLTECQVFIVSGFPEKMIDFKTDQSRKESLMLMQYLSEYNIKCDSIKVDEEIEHHNKYKLVFTTQQIIADSFNHYENHFINLEDVEMQVIIPYSMSLKESLEQIKLIFKIRDANVNLIVSDFDHFFELVREMIFDINKYSKEQEQDVHKKEVCLFVGKIKVHLKEIFEAEFDNSQAKEYLSNVCDSNVQLSEFCLSQHTFSIGMSTLSITKFCKDFVEQKEMKILSIPNLQILDRYPEQLIQIRHDDVIVDCHSEQIAFFGKIFTLINDRILFQNYNQEIYRDLKENFNSKGTLISQIEKMVNKSDTKQNKDDKLKVNKQKKSIYIPKKLTFLLKMKKLSHIITIDGLHYSRYRNLNEMSHEVVISKLCVEHKNFKEFAINDFKITFSETTIQKQLSMTISQIVMQQNEQTLIDYLDSFTLFKHLLQFESDEMSKPTKLFKKYICIDLISIHFGNELVKLKSLKIDKQSNTNQLMDCLYFSIERCEIVLSKIVHPKNSLKEFSPSSHHTLFAIDSFSLRTNNEERVDRVKPKITIIVKGPTFNLPSNNVSKIILSYIKNYANLQNHIEAFLINVTNQKLKAIKYHLKEFFIEPDQLNLIVTGLCFSICDTKLDSNLIAFNKTIRDYLLPEPKYNEAELISILRRNNKANFPLVILKLEKITLEITPIPLIQPNEKSINQWIENFETLNSEAARNNTEERFRRVKAEKFKLKIKGISINIRDYPSPILSTNQIHVSGEKVKIVKIFGRKMNYLMGQMLLGEISISLGLGQLSGWQQISKRMSELNVINQKVQKEFRNHKEELTIWHRVMSQWKWRLQLAKDVKTKIEILTGDTPYNGDKFELQINKIYGQSTTKGTYLMVEHLQLNLKDFNILRMPKLEVSFEVKVRQTLLDIFLFVKMIDDTCSFRISSWIIGYLEELVQLKKDWLLIYGIYQKEIQKNVLQLEDIQNMTYLEIASLLAQKQFNEKNNNSILNFLNHLQFKFFAKHISIGVIEQDLQLALQASKLEAFAVLQPDHDLYNELKIRRSKINSEQLTLTFTKIHSAQNDLIRETRILGPDISKIGKVYEFIKCNTFIINFNWYFTEEKKMGLANQWIYAENITAEISKRMERYCQKMMKILTFHKITKQERQNTHYQPAINKLRKAVLQIIQINRRKKILKGHIKKYNTVIDLQNYKLFLKSEEKMMILEGKEKALFFQRIQYGQDDKYHSQPCEILTLMFPSSKILLSNGPYESNNFQMMRSGKLTLEIQMSDEKIDQGKCFFEDIEIEIAQEGKNILEDIIAFIIDLVNTSEERTRIYNMETAKYEELINNGREKLKEKIEWKQSDLKWKEKEIFEWNFVLKDLSILISTADSNILSVHAERTEMVFHIFDNQKIERKILFKNLQIVNELEPLYSEYRNILELGKDGIGLAVINDSYEVPAFSDVPWKYNKQLSFWVQPIKLRVTEEMLDLFRKFLGDPSSRDELSEYDELKQYKNKTPDYYKLCSIEPVNIHLWFRSPNIFKRMDAIKLRLDKYELKEEFYTQSDLARAVGFWLLKQIGSQIFSLLGQKIFGDFEQ